IQDHLRKRDFARFVTGQVRNVRVLAGNANAPEILTTNEQRFECQDKDRTRGIVLTKSSLALHVSRYRTFEDFCGTYLMALQTINEIVGIGYIERIGLRYVDVFAPTEGEQMSSYVDTKLLGLPNEALGLKGSE